MPSLQTHILNLFLRRVMKSKPLHEMDPVELRAHIERWSQKKIPKDIVIEPVNEGAMRGEWQRPLGANDDGIILYIHGGGYIFGSPRTHRPISFNLARGTRQNLFSLDYRLAPENPVPASVDDALECYRQLLALGYDGSKISVAGDSAGGGLVLALTSAIKKHGLPMPGCLVLFSPWTDLTASGESIHSNEKTDSMFQSVHIIVGAKRALDGGEASAELASPLFADHHGFPPTLIFAGDGEVLLDDSVRLEERMRSAGVDVTLIVEKGLPHAWPVFVNWTPEAKDAVGHSIAFMKQQTNVGRAA